MIIYVNLMHNIFTINSSHIQVEYSIIMVTDIFIFLNNKQTKNVFRVIAYL